ncbi:MAG: NADH:flavin oxidoreductase, partial [Planctomycetota bacterium]
MSYPRIASLKTADAFRQRLAELALALPFDEQLRPETLAARLSYEPIAIGNRFCILPMEGWDGTSDGKPTELTRRRWVNFGVSGAKLMWGCEAVAVRHDGRANPNQLLINDANLASLAELRETLIRHHVDRFDRDDDLLVGLQLTHSGRFARPNAKSQAEPRIAYHHAILDRRLGIEDDSPLLTDDDLKQLIDDFVRAGHQAAEAGFHFVDIKHCHGYLGHELLSGFDRPGEFGGSFENRTRFLREIVAGLQAAVPQLQVGVRLSVFDFVPFTMGEDRVGIPEGVGGQQPFGGDADGLGIDLSEPHRLLKLLAALGIRLVCTTAGSPYYNPHIQRPAAFPPSDGYLPPEDPLVGVTRQIEATAELKSQHPDLILVGSGYSYLQDWLPHVAQ